MTVIMRAQACASGKGEDGPEAERRRLTPELLVSELVERWGDAELAISVMSAGELLHVCWRAREPARRARRDEFVEALLAAIPVIVITLPSCVSLPNSTRG